MTANERYEQAWNAYLMFLNRDSKSRMGPFLRDRRVNVGGMRNWMMENGLFVQSAKLQIRASQAVALAESSVPCSETTGMMFLPVEPSAPVHIQDVLSVISFVFQDWSCKHQIRQRQSSDVTDETLPEGGVAMSYIYMQCLF